MDWLELWRWQRCFAELVCNQAQGGDLCAVVFLPCFVAVIAHNSLKQGVKVYFDHADFDLRAQIERLF